ncbi:MAG TPA: Hsp20/alpha crystallin family protein [Segetibacter sp.]
MLNIIKRNKNGNGDDATRSVMPFGGLVDSVLQNPLSRFFDDPFWGFNGILTNNQVPVNIRETDKSYEIEFVAPGLKKEDFNVNISDNMLTVSFDHKDENKEENKDDGYLRHEYRRQSFSRSFTLDETVNADKISGVYKDGVLNVSIPKKEGVKKITKSIEIK